MLSRVIRGAALTVLAVAAAGASTVTINKTVDGDQLMKDGTAWFIKGAGGSQKLDVLAASGGNSIRTWSADTAVLDQAHARGLTILIGLCVGLPRHGFDYSNPAAVAKQLDEIRRTVLKLKHHPALLMWSVGHEVELGVSPENRPALWSKLEQVVQTIKKAEGRHPMSWIA